MNFGDYMQYLTPTKRESRSSHECCPGTEREGKDLLEYPVVKKYVDMFNWKKYPSRDIDLLHYDVGYNYQTY